MSFILKRKAQFAIEFHINDLKPTVALLDDAIWFSADGDELELVRSQFDNLPITKGNYCLWTGELAYFVFRNLTLSSQ